MECDLLVGANGSQSTLRNLLTGDNKLYLGSAVSCWVKPEKVAELLENPALANREVIHVYGDKYSKSEFISSETTFNVVLEGCVRVVVFDNTIGFTLYGKTPEDYMTSMDAEELKEFIKRFSSGWNNIVTELIEHMDWTTAHAQNIYDRSPPKSVQGTRVL